MTTIPFVTKIAIYVIVFIVVLSIFQFLISIHPPRYSSKRTPATYDIPYENVSFKTKDGIIIKGWFIKSPKANGTVIIGHGYPFDKGNILGVGKFLYPDYNLLFYDHRYFGDSTGRISTVGIKEIEDVKAAVAFVQEKFPSKPIALYGFSLSASAMLMSKADVKAIVADSPYANLELMVKHIYGMFGPLKFPFVITTNLLSRVVFGIYPSDVSPAKAIQNTTVPMFVIHGEKDTQIPVENAYVLKESNPNIELWIVKGVEHGFSYAETGEDYEKRIKDFLRKHMK